jgi:hypothetical protein
MTTREEAIALLKKCQEPGDTEAAHAEADDILCALLRDLGYGDVVDEYDKVAKWYA